MFNVCCVLLLFASFHIVFFCYCDFYYFFLVSLCLPVCLICAFVCLLIHSFTSFCCLVRNLFAVLSLFSRVLSVSLLFVDGVLCFFYVYVSFFLLMMPLFLTFVFIYCLSSLHTWDCFLLCLFASHVCHSWPPSPSAHELRTRMPSVAALKVPILALLQVLHFQRHPLATSCRLQGKFLILTTPTVRWCVKTYYEAIN